MVAHLSGAGRLAVLLMLMQGLAPMLDVHGRSPHTSLGDTLAGYIHYSFNGGSNDCLLLQHDAAVGERLHLARVGEFGRQNVECGFSFAAYHSYGWPDGGPDPERYAYFDLYAGSGYPVYFSPGDRLSFNAHRIGAHVDSLEVIMYFAPNETVSLLRTDLKTESTTYLLPLPNLTLPTFVNFRFHAWSSTGTESAGDVLVLDEVVLTFHEISEGTSHSERPPIPADWTLHPPAPNPTHAGAMIYLDVENPSSVTIDVFDTGGRAVRRFARQFYLPGRHLMDLETGGLAAGVYFIRASDGRASTSRQLVLVR